MIKHLLLLPLTASLLILTLPAYPLPNPPVSATVPFTSLTAWAMPLIQVKVNGKTTATLAVDTGTNFSALTDHFAAHIGTTPQPYTQNGKPYDVLGKQAKAVTLLSLQIGSINFQSQRMLILKGKTLTSLLGQPVDGIIGTDILQHLALSINYPQRQLTLISPGQLVPAQLAQEGFGTATVLSLTVQPKTGLFLTPAVFTDGTETASEDVCLDTGSGVTVVSYRLAQQLKLNLTQPGIPTTTFNGSFVIGKASGVGMQLGRLAIPSVNIVFPTVAHSQYTPRLGANFFGNHSILFDFPGLKMYVAANAVKPLSAPPLSALPASGQRH